MQNLNEQQRGLMLTIAIVTRGNDYERYQPRRYRAVGPHETARLVFELTAMRLIEPDGRSVKFTSGGRRCVQAWLEQRLQETGTLHPATAVNPLRSGFAEAS